MTIRDELLNLKNADGLIIPEEVLQWARRHPRSALHQAINWDVEYNLNAYLLLQIRNLITLNIRNEEREPAMISLSIDRAEAGGGYREISDVVAVPQLRRVMLKDALHELELLQRRFAELVELEPIWEAADRVRRPPPPRKGRGSGIQPAA